MPPVLGTEAEKKSTARRVSLRVVCCDTQMWGTIKPLVSPSKGVMVTAAKSSSPLITPFMPVWCPDNMLHLQRVWTLLLLFKHRWVMTGLWLSSKPLHLPISSSSGSWAESQRSRVLEWPPCPPRSICCLQNRRVPGWCTADFSALGSRNHYSRESQNETKCKLEITYELHNLCWSEFSNVAFFILQDEA